MSTFEDRFAIYEAHQHYLASVDSHEAEPFVENFTEDGVYVSPFGTAEGRDQIRSTILQWHEGGVTRGKRHMLGPVVISLLSETMAKAHSSYFVLETETTPGVVASGGYEDEWRKVDGRWKLARRVQTVDPSFKMGG